MAAIIRPNPEGPIQAATIVALASGRESTPVDLFTVPAGLRLVIEYVTFACTANVHDDHAVVRLRIGATLRGALVWHDVDTLAAVTDWSGTSQLVRIYADPGTVVHALVDRVFRPPSTARISFTGQLERVPTSPVLEPTAPIAGTAKRSHKRAA
jgi:hypothetical protein